MSYHRHPPPRTRRPAPAPAGKAALDRYRADRYRAVYRVEPPPTEKLFAGPLTWRQFHDLWYTMIAPVPKTDAGLQITLHLYSTLRDWLNTIEIVDSSYESERRLQEIKKAAINSGAILPFDSDREPKRTTRTVELDQPPPWTPGPCSRRAS